MLKRLGGVPLLLTFAALVTCTGGGTAETIVVQPGTSTIQEAIDRAAPHDTIAVSPGTYMENLIIREKNGITLLGREGAENTIIDGNEKDRLISLEKCEGTISIAGFTFQRGYTTGNGGGIECLQSNIAIDSCRFLDNECGNEGGGIMLSQTTSYSISNCLFERNSALATAGLNILGGEGEVHHNLFRQNRGGLIVLLQFSGAHFHDNVVVRNEAPRFGPVVYLYPMGGSVVGNTIAFNSGKPGEGALVVRSGKGLVDRNLICYNEDVFGLGFESPDRLVQVTNNITWGNDGGPFTLQEPDETNLEKDPLFCDSDNDDYSLQAASPCLPTESRDRVGALGRGCD